MAKILTTTNYRLFKSSEHNRPLEPKKHKPLMASMKEVGFLPEFPIVAYKNGSGEMHVKDGQHRLWVAEQLGLPVFYVMATADWDVAKINRTFEDWKLMDYVAVYAAQGKQAYAEAMAFAKENNVAVSVALALLAGTTTYTNVRIAFMTGEYEVKDRAWAESVAKLYVPFVAASAKIKNRRFTEACMAVCRVSDFSHKRMLQNLQRCHDKLASYSTRDAYLEMLEDIYNFGRRDLVPLRLQAITAMRDRNVTNGSKSDK